MENDNAPKTTLSELDNRAREVFRTVVESYLSTGDPIGSRTLSKNGIALSSASIRNTLQDLAAIGLLSAPHISSGRLPTQLGLRLFVDGLLEIGDIIDSERAEIDRVLMHQSGDGPHRFDDALRAASKLLSGLTQGASLVLTPHIESPISQIEAVSLNQEQALIVLVHEDGRVENRIMSLKSGQGAFNLTKTLNFLSEARSAMSQEYAAQELALDEAARRLIDHDLAFWGTDSFSQKRSLLVRGRAQLLQSAQSQDDVERVRQLLEDLEHKEDLLNLLDGVMSAQGVRIFIGSESRLFSLSASAVIAAPYQSNQDSTTPRVLGAIGVIGPTRLNYARIIPLVDYTAKILGRLYDQEHRH
jgi:heat-inducible transcriptional repressor